MDYRAPGAGAPVPTALEPPRELSMVSLPTYRIEPPDILQVEMTKMVPLPPYHIQQYDVLQVQAAGTLLGQPIFDLFLVDAEGTVHLGPAYGAVQVQGMSIDEAQQAIVRHLESIGLVAPEVAVQLAQASGIQPVTGQYLVGPDGTINLRKYGTIHLAGKTVSEARALLERHFSQFFDEPTLSLDVLAYNSKVYYVITEGAGLGDSIVRVPITGNETVLDAIGNVGGLSQVSSKKIWVARPAPGGVGCDQILPVDYEAIAHGGLTATNYQLLPGDRLFIAEDSLVAMNNWIGKVLSPIERVAGVTSLGASTVRNVQTLGRNFNLFRGRVSPVTPP
jgi:polysaccharide biosynthesis/export protein